MVWIPFWKLLGFVLYVLLYVTVCNAHVDYPEETATSAFFKVLPMTQLIFIVMSTDLKEWLEMTTDQGFSSYKRNIMAGLIISSLGDVCLVWRIDLFILGLLFFAIAHVFYIRAFGLKPVGGGPTLVSCLIVAGTLFSLILPGTAKEDPIVMPGLVLMYSCLIFLLFWRAIVCLQLWPGFGSLCACAGALLFVTSDFIIAYDKWVAPVPGAAGLIMWTYLVAQLGICLSVPCFTPRALKRD